MTDLIQEIQFVASRLYFGFSRFVERDDIGQEIALYAWGDGKRHVDRLVERGDTTRLRLLLYQAGRQYCEREKAYKSGYSFSDLAWYTPDTLRDLIPLAQDPDFDGMTGDLEDNPGAPRRNTAPDEGGSLLAMIADTRRALAACPDAAHDLSFAEEGSDEHALALRQLVEFLGGDYPKADGYHARRYAISNSSAACRVALN